MVPPMRPALREGIWRLADPKISLASVASMALGTGAAVGAGAVAWEWLPLVLVGIFALEVAKNAAGEVVDWDSGVDLGVAPEDRSPFSGGKRVMVEGLLTREEAHGVAAAGWGIALLAGVALVIGRDTRVLLIALPGAFLAWAYHGDPLRLAYRGGGELAVLLAYGPGIALGTALVLRGSIPPALPGHGVLLGLLIASFLWINQFPDEPADRAAGKRTLVVRLGRHQAARLFALVPAVVTVGALTLAVTTNTPAPLLGLAGMIPLLRAVRVVLRSPANTPSLIPAQRDTLVAFLLFAGGTALGLALGA